MHKLLDAAGNLTSGPRLFTTASVRGILHNVFYIGKVAAGNGTGVPGRAQANAAEEAGKLLINSDRALEATVNNG